MVQPGTGRVLAMAVNRPFGSDPNKHQSTVNLATGGASGFQAGSTFKLFTLAAALQQGLSPALRLPAPTSYTATGFTNCTSGATYPRTPSATPKPAAAAASTWPRRPGNR